LTRHGYTVLEAANEPEALAAIRERQGPIHLLLTDLLMSGMSGPALARHLAADRRDLRVLYMSDYTDGAEERKLLEPGTVLLQKPFSPEVLLRKVREVLRGAAPAAGPGDSSSAAARRPIVLAVDDEPSILEWLTRSLDRFGYEVLAAEDAYTAYGILQAAQVDALILDARLIGPSGLEVLRFVRFTKTLASFPVIVLTGATALTETEEEMIRQKHAHVIFKPQAIAEIAATLHRLLERSGSDPPLQR
jgi:DNA-binding response OmpR family regulator